MLSGGEHVILALNDVREMALVQVDGNRAVCGNPRRCDDEKHGTTAGTVV
jgi:hypothetical protein